MRFKIDRVRSHPVRMMVVLLALVLVTASFGAWLVLRSHRADSDARKAAVEIKMKAGWIAAGGNAADLATSAQSARAAGNDSAAALLEFYARQSDPDIIASAITAKFTGLVLVQSRPDDNPLELAADLAQQTRQADAQGQALLLKQVKFHGTDAWLISQPLGHEVVNEEYWFDHHGVHVVDLIGDEGSIQALADAVELS
jgi:hypothetical protein